MKIILKEEPVIIKTKKYSTIDFSLIFPIKYQKKYIYYPDFISNLIVTSSHDYPTEQEFQLARNKELIIKYRIIPRRFLNNIYLKFNFCLPDPKKVHDYNIKSAFSFIMNSILKPNASNGSFNSDVFKREYDYFKEYYANEKVDKYSTIYRNFAKAVNDKLYNKYSYIANLKELSNIDATSLYNYYKKNILDNHPLIYVYGNITKTEVNDLFKDYFKKEIENVSIKKDYYYFINPRENIQYVEKKYEISDSILYLAYMKENLTKEELIYFYFLIDIINIPVGISPLFKKLRIDNNLVYYINASLMSKYGILYLKTSFNIYKKNKVLELIQECFNELKDKDIIEKYRKIVIRTIKDNIIKNKDYKYALFVDRITKDLELGYSLEDYLEFYTNLDLDLFIKFINEIKLDTIYLARGDLDERN